MVIREVSIFHRMLRKPRPTAPQRNKPLGIVAAFVNSSRYPTGSSIALKRDSRRRKCIVEPRWEAVSGETGPSDPARDQGLWYSLRKRSFFRVLRMAFETKLAIGVRCRSSTPLKICNLLCPFGAQRQPLHELYRGKKTGMPNPPKAFRCTICPCALLTLQTMEPATTSPC